MRLRSPRARLYTSVRTAHLERAHQLAPAALVYRTRRYDFDESLTTGLELVQASTLRAAAILARSRLVGLEINEPLWREIIPGTALAVAAIALCTPRRAPRAVVATYIIGNTNPFERAPHEFTLRGLKRRARARLELALARYLWHRLDRIVYGTPSARDNYRAILGPPRRAEEALILPLPAAPAATPGNGLRPERVVFLGALVERKGLPLVVQAWPLVHARRPDAKLLVMGKGALEGLARELAEHDGSVELIVDPPRDRIRAELAASRVLALPSQRTPTWREQVGLPIVEGLEQGCRIVTSTEGGLATWLRERGHGVVAAPSTAEDVADAIVAQLDKGGDPSPVFAALPPRDGRLVADDWMFGQHAPVGAALSEVS